jgi:dihydrofolate reductase
MLRQLGSAVAKPSITNLIMKTQYYTATSIDGYIADENNSLDWLFQFGMIESMQTCFPRFISKVGAVAMGSTTYKWVVKQEKILENPEKWPYKIPTWVFSRRKLPVVDGADIRFVRGNVAPLHAEMEKVTDGKNLWIVSGGDLVGQFYDHGLLDEIILSVAPVMLGSDAPLFPRNVTAPPMKLVDIQKHEDVFATIIYEVQKSH